jgi:hypothetical protein
MAQIKDMLPVIKAGIAASPKTKNFLTHLSQCEGCQRKLERVEMENRQAETEKKRATRPTSSLFTKQEPRP